MNVLSDVPPLGIAAFLLDLDGTLLDIAPAPDQVVVDPSLKRHLQQLRRQCGDALAIVTGRPIAQVDGLLDDIPFAVAGEHGTAIRHAPGGAIDRLIMPSMPETWWRDAARLVDAYPGTMLEPKTHGLVLHYRAAPQAGAALYDGLQKLLSGQPGDYTLMAAKMAWEIRPTATDKGTAVRALMRQPPFFGRMPVFVGDDVTDEDGMDAARSLGGIGLRVPEVFGDAAGVRAWIGLLITETEVR